MSVELGEQAIALMAVGAVAGVVLLSVLLLVQSLRLSRVRRALAGSSKRATAEEVASLNGDDRALADRVGGLGAAVTALQAELEDAVSRVGVVRYDAFGDSGGTQSFSVALVDGNASGVILTGLNARSASRCYAKALREGQADVELSPEEQAAFEAAMAHPTGSATVAPARRRRAS